MFESEEQRAAYNRARRDLIESSRAEHGGHTVTIIERVESETGLLAWEVRYDGGPMEYYRSWSAALNSAALALI